MPHARSQVGYTTGSEIYSDTTQTLASPSLIGLGQGESAVPRQVRVKDHIINLEHGELASPSLRAALEEWCTADELVVYMYILYSHRGGNSTKYMKPSISLSVCINLSKYLYLS